MTDLTEREWTGGDSRLVDLIDRGTVLCLEDRRKGSIAPLRCAEPLPVDVRLGYELSLLWRANDFVECRAQIGIGAVDGSGVVLKEFWGREQLGCEWLSASVRVVASAWPKGTVGAVVLLRAKTDPEATGRAYFRKIFFEPLEKSAIEMPQLSGERLTRLSYFKYSGIELSSRLLQKGEFAFKQEVPTLEVSWFGEEKMSSLQLVTDCAAMGEVRVAAWCDKAQSFLSSVVASVSVVGGSQVIDLTALPETSKIMVTWPDVDKLEIYKAEIRKVEYPCQEWHASWIWGKEEREDYVNGCFRHVFELSELPVEAHIQHRHSWDYERLELNGASLLGDITATTDISKLFRVGRNLIAAKILQKRYFAGLLVEIDMRFADGRRQKVVSDGTWKAFDGDAPEGWSAFDFDDSGWTKAIDNGHPGLIVSDDTPIMQGMGAEGYVDYLPKGRLSIVAHTLPQVLVAGREYHLEWNLRLENPAQRESTPVTVRFMRGGEVFFIWRLGMIDGAAETQCLKSDVRLSAFLPEGEYTLVFQTSGFCIDGGDGGDYSPVVRVENSRSEEELKAELRMHNGAQTIFVNGVPQIFTSTAQDFAISTTECSRRFGRRGINIFSIYPIMKIGRDGSVDFSSIDNYAVRALEGNPNAWLLVRIQMRPSVPQWFIDEYPEELVRYDAGGGRPLPSLASLKWREVAGDAVRKSIEHIKSSPYGGRVIGYFIYEGEEGQWMNYWGGGDPTVPDSMGDYSEAMRCAYRRWLCQRYPSEEAFRQAREGLDVMRAREEIPSREARIAGRGAFRDTCESRAAMDFAECISDTVVDGINYYGRIIKETTEGRALYGVLYGHLVDLAAFWLGENVGYLKQRRVVESPYVDILVGPHYYLEPFRNEGGIGSQDFPAPVTLALNGKLWVNEDDMRTHLRYPQEYEYTMHDVQRSRQGAGRHFAMALCSGAGNYFYDLTSARNWYDDPELMEAFGEFAEIEREAINRDRTPKAEIALVFDDVSCMNYRSMPSWVTAIDNMAMQMTIFNREQLGRIGAPFSIVLLDDIFAPAAPKYRLYIFANDCRMSAERRKSLRKLLDGNSATALWLHASALFNDNGEMNPAFTSELTGCTHRLDEAPRQCRLKYADGSIWGDHCRMAPTLIPDGADEILARFEADGAPALVRKGRNFFSAVPAISREAYLQIAKAAGVELFTDGGDAVYHCQDYLAIHTSMRSGERILRAPSGCLIRQIWPKDEHYGEISKERIIVSAQPSTLIFEVISSC